MSGARLEIAYTDHRDDRMIIVGAAAWETMAEQEVRFAELLGVEDSDFIVDFYGEDGLIEKDKCVSAETVSAVMGEPIEALSEIARGAAPADQHGHYLAHREAVRIARAALTNGQTP
jgi:hypothetical protein